ncbi:MAG: hypothetical protein GWO02_00340, partial [Gammaproteobacteria bacterium]|nr:hypothetical protein [Gammaproteobacteria bacterium]
ALFLSVPSAPTTQALTLLVANAAIFWALVKLLPGIEIEGILPALAAPVVFTCASLLIDRYGREIDWVAIIQWS